MKIRFRLLLVTLVLQTSSAASAMEELFSDVSLDVQYKLVASDEMFYEERKYFSYPHRVRIVRINTDLLLDTGKLFSVTPFADRSIVVRSDGFINDRYGKPTSQWEGMTIPQFAQKNAEVYSDPYYKINLTVRKRHYESGTGNSRVYEEKYDSRNLNVDAQELGISGRDFAEPYAMPILTVTGTIFVESSGPIRLERFPSDPRYALVWEEDRSKSDIFDDRVAETTTDNLQQLSEKDRARIARAQAFREHMEAVEDQIAKRPKNGDTGDLSQ